MKKHVGWLALAAVGATALLAPIGCLLAVRWQLSDDERLAEKVSAHFERISGVPLRVNHAHAFLLPAPTLVLSEVSTVQARPITLRQMTLRLRWSPLWRGELAVAQATVDGAVLPRASVRALRQAIGDTLDADQPSLAVDALGGRWTVASQPLERVRWRDVVWIDRRDIGLVYDGEVRFDAHWRLRNATLRRPNASPPAQARIEREEGRGDVWRAQIQVGGGTWNGRLELQRLSSHQLRLYGEFLPREVDAEALARTFGRRSPVAGKINGQMQLSAEGSTPIELLRGLHTHTAFGLRPAVLARPDLVRALGNVGRAPLDEITGILDTQNTRHGVRMRYSRLEARSGMLNANGQLTVLNRRLDGEMAIDLVNGWVGVPLKIGGTVESPQLSFTASALTGAAVGTAVLPGVGTAIGARMGHEVERLWGDDMPAPSRKPRAVSVR